MDAHFSHKRQIRGLLFGIIAGLTFSIATWGVDAWQLQQASAAFPFIKFIPGAAISVLAGGLVGWLTTRVEHALFSLISWVALAVLYNWLVLWLPLKATPLLLARLQPTLAHLLYYPRIDNQYQFAIVGMIVIGAISLLTGLMQNHLIDQSMLADGTLPLISPVLISVVLFGIAGVSSNYLVNKHFREPTQALDNLIQFAADNQGKEVATIVAREKRLSVVEDLGDIITSPRRVTLIGYDKTLGQVDFLVDFEGKWVRCTVIYNQPTMCKRISYDALRYADDAIQPWVASIDPVNKERFLTKLSKFSEEYQYPLSKFQCKL